MENDKVRLVVYLDTWSGAPCWTYRIQCPHGGAQQVLEEEALRTLIAGPQAVIKHLLDTWEYHPEKPCACSADVLRQRYVQEIAKE